MSKKQNTLLDSLQKLLDKKTEPTKIGTLKIREYAVVFPQGFPVKYTHESNTIKQQVDVKNKSLKKENKNERATSHEITVKEDYQENKKAPPYKKGEKVQVKIAYIDSVRVAISEGVMEYVNIYAGGSSFYNTRSPIPILTMERRFNDKPHNPYDGSFIFLKDALYFEGGSRFNYFPDGDVYSSSNVTVGENKTQATLHTPYFEAVLKNKKLNNFGFDLRFGHLWQKLNPNEFIDNSEWNRLISFKARIFYFPSKNPSDKIFLRFAKRG